MHAFTRRVLEAAVLAGSAIALGAGIAHASESTSGQGGIASGNQATAPLNVPITVTGNGIGVLGHARASQAAPATDTQAADPGATPSKKSTSGDRGITSGNQVTALINVPVNVTGNGVGLLGHGSSTKAKPATPDLKPGGSNAKTSKENTSGQRSAASGNQITAPISVPVTATGNGIGVLGHGNATTEARPTGPTGSEPARSTNTTSGQRGIASGTQISAPISVPVTATGNGIGVLGHGNATYGAPVRLEPDLPAQPEQPEQPGQPGQPGQPEQPGQPAQPERPAVGADTEQPSGGVDPATAVADFALLTGIGQAEAPVSVESPARGAERSGFTQMRAIPRGGVEAGHGPGDDSNGSGHALLAVALLLFGAACVLGRRARVREMGA